jgi:hypothetical protein
MSGFGRSHGQFGYQWGTQALTGSLLYGVVFCGLSREEWTQVVVAGFSTRQTFQIHKVDLHHVKEKRWIDTPYKLQRTPSLRLEITVGNFVLA